jgi:hypothetical protein
MVSRAILTRRRNSLGVNRPKNHQGISQGPPKGRNTMRHRRLLHATAVFGTIIALIVISGAGSSTRSVWAASEGALGQPVAGPSSSSETLDDRFADVARKLPAFGGVFFDSRGRLTIYMVDGYRLASAPTEEAMAAAEVAAILPRDDRIARTRALRVLPGRYSFLSSSSGTMRSVPMCSPSPAWSRPTSRRVTTG